ncbi:hypothetical protein C0989_009787 [Termitomyces sp. Mn162]|nr:hypothetical protein C0989_009787 [Termitomyces sp. Mn162]
MLGFVETYDPQYFLLENVAGLLTHRLMSTRSKHKRTLVGGIQGGMVKFIKRTLIALGYQVRCKVLQATQYGAPQSRRRVIFWGAKRGLTIPDYPVPMYASAKGMNRSTLPTGMLEPMSRSRDSEFMHHCAPLRAVSVDDAISDLPPFDWISPHKILPCTSKDKQAVRLRIEQGIPQFTATQAARMPLPGFPEGTEYLTEPQNRYQKWLRRGMGEDEVVEGHYTKFFTPSVVEATVAVPLKPAATHRGADWFVMGSWLIMAMTDAGEQQKRIMSVRELARSQGFPDDYEFMSEDQSQNGQRLVVNQIRQIGNAVPVPFALCLGKSLGGALLKDWERDRERREREGSVVV